MYGTSRTNRLAFEQLERREMLSASPSNAEAFASRGELIESLKASIPALESSSLARPMLGQGSLLGQASKDVPPMDVFPANVTDPFEMSLFEHRPMHPIEDAPSAQELKTRPTRNGLADDLSQESPVGVTSSPVRVLPEVIDRLLADELGVPVFGGQIPDHQIASRDAFVAYESRFLFESFRNAAPDWPRVNDVVTASAFGTPVPIPVPLPARWLTARLESEGLLDVSRLTAHGKGPIPTGTYRAGISPSQRLAPLIDFSDIALPEQIVLGTVQTPIAFNIEVALIPSHSIAQPLPNQVQRSGEHYESASSSVEWASDLPLTVLESSNRGALPHEVLFGENRDGFDDGFVTLFGSREQSFDSNSTGPRETRSFLRGNEQVRDDDELPLLRFWERVLDDSAVARPTRLSNGDEPRRGDVASGTKSTGSSASSFRRLSLQLPDDTSDDGMVAITSTDYCPSRKAADMQVEPDRLPIEVAGACGRVRAFDVEAVAAEQPDVPHAEESSRYIEPMTLGSSPTSVDAAFSEEPRDDRHQEAAILPGMLALFGEYWRSTRTRKSCKSSEKRVPQSRSS